MNNGQYEGIMMMLREIRDRMPESTVPEPNTFTVNHLDGSKTVTTQYPDGTKTVNKVPTSGPTITHHRTGTTMMTVTGSSRQEVAGSGARTALATMLRVLDDWIEGSQANHEAGPHRGENRGEECWRSFAPSDIRSMVNDAARELGADTFPAPNPAQEDTTEGRVRYP